MFYPHGYFSARRHGVAAAFTLLEVLVTITIVIALSAIALRATHHAGQASRVARTRAELAVLAVALEEYRRLCGDYPRTGDSARLLQSLIGRRGPRDEAIELRSFMELTRFSTLESRDPFSDTTATVVDPWGQRYRYAYKTQSPWDNPNYVLYSVGADGADSTGLLAGGFANPAPVENADNLYANATR
jgi:type II secretory pathway pseudopilin PulG